MLIKIDDDRKRLKEIPSSVIGIQKDLVFYFLKISLRFSDHGSPFTQRLSLS